MNGGDVLRRKIRAADGRKPDATVMEFAENLTAQISEALLLEPKFTLHAVFDDAEIISFKSFLASVPSKSLFCFTTDVMFHIDNPLAYAWVEKGLSGESPLDEAAASAYAPTAIDACLSRPFFECLMTSLQRDLPKQYRLAESGYEDAMSIERHSDNVHFLEEAAKVVSLRFRFVENETHNGHICRIVLPLGIIEEIALTVKPRSRDDAPTSGLWTKHMREELLDLPLQITAVIERTHLSVDEIARLAPGKHIILARENMENVILGIETRRGLKALGSGRLGLQNRAKAVKLNASPSANAATLATLARRG